MPILVIVIVVAILIARTFQKNKQSRQLIDLQNYVTGVNYSHLTMTTKQLENKVRQFMNSHATILKNCEKNLNTTNSPRVYFDNLEKFMESKKAIEGLHNIYPSVGGNFASAKEIEKLTDEMIDRMWRACVEKIALAKTDRGKSSARKAYLDTIELYRDKLTENNYQYALSKVEE